MSGSAVNDNKPDAVASLESSTSASLSETSGVDGIKLFFFVTDKADKPEHLSGESKS
jgi:hypothetical protein